ncbi:hypothetical protein [Bacillus sp. Bva_UNVM-123]|uniref:hypothetical protein n=1 Tax=Bacillus sp. Bva_UNVM-123 TaxID=2829798 RepID=UPI00391F6884
MSIDNLRYIIKRISNRAGIKKYTSLSITKQLCYTYMINNGTPLEVIQSLLGHVRLLNKAVAFCVICAGRFYIE